MAVHREVTRARRILGKLDHGKDLLEELTRVAESTGVRLGRVEALGAVSRARLGFYNQEEREYEFFEVDRPMEIASLVGNVSLKDGAPMVHAHVTLSDEKGRASGGHLAPGTVVFACEFSMEVLGGPELVRAYDERTGLPLWEM